MDLIKLIIKLLLKALLHIFWIFPVKKDRIFLLNDLSYTYGDNLKYLNVYIHKKYPQKYEVVFPIKRNKQSAPHTICVSPRTIRYFYYVMTSGTIITNNGGVSYLPKRRDQLIINTWHGGGPYKRTGMNVYKNIWYKIETKMNEKNVDYILAACSYFTDYESKDQLYPSKKCVRSGMPRNDIFFRDTSKIKNRFYSFYGISFPKKIVLYAPTYRGMVDDRNSSKKYGLMGIDIAMVKEALHERFGGEWVFAVRLHPKMTMIGMEDKTVMNLSDYPDMQEILYSVDAVISDYSSLIWDYSFTFRPCFLYATDVGEYQKDRDFYMPIHKWPFSLACNNDQLRKNILSYNQELYIEKVKKHHDESGSYETGNACRKVMELVERRNGNKEF